MEEFFSNLIEHIYEIAVGIAVILGGFLNKPKTAEQLKKARERKIEKLENAQQKEIAKIKANAKKIDELKGVNENATSVQ